tara:strand:+ start:202 stop:4176 length:3975 start_codon:yes stop_codon:yes gene_type:complete
MAEIQTIGDVDAARKWLLQNRDGITNFEEKYGEGSAVAVLRGTYEPPEEPEGPSILDQAMNFASNTFSAIGDLSFEDALDGIGDTLQGVGRGIISAPTELAETLINLNTMDTAKAGSIADNAVARRNAVLTDEGRAAMSPEAEAEFRERINTQLALSGIRVSDERVDVDVDDVIEGVNKVAPVLNLPKILEKPDTTVGNLAEGFTQFVAGYVMLGGGGKLVKALGTGAAVDFAMFDPYDRNISAMMEENEWMIPYVTEALATDTEGSEWENRLRNSAEGGLLGVALEGVVASIRQYSKLKKAQRELADDGEVSKSTLKELEEAEAEVQKFSDLEGKPKGKLRVDGKFETDEGMVFDPSTGLRDFESEKLLVPNKDFSNDMAGMVNKAVDNIETPVRPDAPEVDATVVYPKVKKAPTQPKSLLNKDVLLKVAKNAKKRDAPVTFDNLGTRVGLFNWEKMDGPMDGKKLMDSLGDAIKESGGIRAAKTQTHEQISMKVMAELKDLTGADLPAMRQRYAETAKTTEDLAVQVTAGKVALQSTSRRITQLVDELDALERAKQTNTEVEEKLIDMLELHADMQASVKNIQTEAARATTAGRIRTADAITDDALNKIDRYGGSKRLRKLAKQIKAAPNEAAKSKLIRKGTQRTWLGKAVDVVNEVWLNAILSGPHTHALNIGANSINVMVRPAIRMVGGTLTANPRQVEEGFRQYMYLTGEIGNSLKTIASVGMYGGDSAIRNVFRSWWREEGILDTASKFDKTGPMRAISSENLGGGQMTNFVGKSMRLAGRTLQAEDEMFKQIVFNARLKSMVMAEARRMTDSQIEAAGYNSRGEFIEMEISKARESQESLAEKWQMMVMTGKVADDAKARDLFIQKNIGAYNHNSKYAQDALLEARETTFTTPLAKGSFGKGVQDFINNIPLLRQIMPFIQTPTNILRNAFERTPVLNMIVTNQRELLLKGTAEQRAMVVGNTSVGVMATYLAVNAAMQGRITGGGPSYDSEMDKAKLWNASPDWQPYSLNVGTAEEPQWIELKKLDPHGFLFGVVGDIYEMSQYMGETRDPELTKLMAMVAASFSNNVMSKTYMMSLADSINMFDGSAKPYQIDQFLQNRVASLVPYSGFSYQMNQDQDEAMRELRSLIDKVKARIYGQNSAAIKYDWLTGESTDTPEYMLGFVRQKKVDSGEHKAAKVYSELRNLNHAFVGPTKKIGDIVMSPEVFQRYNQLLGTVKGRGRRTLLEDIEKMINSNTYKKVAQAAEIERVRSQDDPRVKLINTVISAYKKRAQLQLFKEYPDLRDAVYSNKAIRKTIQNGGDAALADNLIFEFPPK